MRSGARAGRRVQPCCSGQVEAESRTGAGSAGFERQQGQRQLLLAAQISWVALPSIPLFPFLPFHPHKFFSQPFQNGQPAKVYSFPADSVLQTLYLCLTITTCLSYHFFLEHQRKTDSTHPPFLILQYSAFACYSLVGGMTRQGPPAYTGFSFFYLCPETFVVSPSWCHGWAVVATCRPLVILYACKISISLGGTPNLCTCYRVSPGTKSTFYSFKCSTVILIFSSLLSHYIINGYFAYASWLAVLFTEELCWSWICYLIKTLIKILFPWVKEHIHIRECEVLSALFRNWKEKRQYWK